MKIFHSRKTPIENFITSPWKIWYVRKDFLSVKKHDLWLTFITIHEVKNTENMFGVVFKFHF